MPEVIRRYAIDATGGMPPSLPPEHEALLPSLIAATQASGSPRSEIAGQIARIAAHKPMRAGLTDDQRRAVMLDYVEALSEQPGHAIEAAVRWAIRESTFFPTLAELLEQCRIADRPRLIAKQRLDRLKWEADRKPKRPPTKQATPAEIAEMNRVLAEMGSAVRIGGGQQGVAA